MTDFIQDVGYALRTLRRTPGFASLILLTLGLGVGAATAIFSAVNDVILRPLPYPSPDRLVMLWESNDERGWVQVHAAPANGMDWRERVAAFEDVAFLSEFTSSVALSGSGDPQPVVTSQVSGNMFTVLGSPPFLGRTFTFQETWADARPVVVLGYDAWQRYLGGDPEAIGRTIRLDGTAYEVVGIMGPEFRLTLNAAEMWTTYRWTQARRESLWFRQAHVVRAVARLRDGVSIETARAELTAVGETLEREYPETNRAMRPGLTPLQPFLVGDRRVPLLFLFGSVIVLQLIACANVANLLLARSVGRRQELAVRCALGAGRARVVRQVLTESLVMSVGGSLLGIGIGIAGLRWISTLSPPDTADVTLHVDWRLAAFATLVTGLSAMLFGVLPALRSAGTSVAAVLTDGSRTGSTGHRNLRAAGGLVSVEIGLAVMLVVGAGLMVRSLHQLNRVDSGADLDNLLTFQVTPPSGTYPSHRDRVLFVYEFLERLKGVPGVAHAGAGRKLPLTGWGWTSDFTIDGWGAEEFGIEVRHREATPGYFETMGIPVLEGRTFDWQLGPETVVPVVVNQAFAERYFRGDSPVGRRIAFDREPGENSYWYAIIGVVGNERLTAAEEPRPEVIAHLAGDSPQAIRFALKTTVPPLTIASAVRAALAEIDPEIPLASIRTMDGVAADALASERFLMTLLAVFAVSALALAAVGVYGVAAQAARARIREIGIRMALGASAKSIIRLLVWRGAGFVVAGLVLGLVGATAAGRLVEGLLFGVKPTDPITLAAVCVVLTGVALLSSYVPARRATRQDPVRVLKE